MNGGAIRTETRNIDIAGLKVKSIKGCSVELRKTTSPPEFFMDCSKVQIALDKVGTNYLGIVGYSAAITLVGNGVTFQAPLSSLAVV